MLFIFSTRVLIARNKHSSLFCAASIIIKSFIKWAFPPLPLTISMANTRGLYYKTFYPRDCYSILISQAVSYCHSLQPQSNLCRPGQSLETYSPLQDSSQMVGSEQPFPQMLDQGGSKGQWQTLACFYTAKITAIKCYIVQSKRLCTDIEIFMD